MPMLTWFRHVRKPHARLRQYDLSGPARPNGLESGLDYANLQKLNPCEDLAC